MRSRGWRRHHEVRMKRRVQDYYGGYARGKPRSIGRLAHSPQICSCRACGNPRRQFKALTLQELKALEAERTDECERSADGV
jgi:hypothetical protein